MERHSDMVDYTSRGSSRAPHSDMDELEAGDLEAISVVAAVATDVVAIPVGSHEPDAHPDENDHRSQQRHEDNANPQPHTAAVGRVINARSANPFGDEDDVCGVCLENMGRGKMVALWCCRNVLCLADAQKIGACPFCREEPLMWNLRI